MPTFGAASKYIEVAFAMSSISEDEQELRGILKYLYLSTAVTKEEFADADYADRMLLIKHKGKDGTELLKAWLEKQPLTDFDYYMKKVISFVKAYQIVEAKSEKGTPNIDVVIQTNSLLQEYVQDMLTIENDTELTNLLQPIIDITKVNLESTIVIKEVQLETKNIQSLNQSTNKFKPLLNKRQQEKLLDLLQERNYVNNPKDFVGFLIGKNEGDGIEITDGSLIDVSYLFYLLYRHGLIAMEKGKNYQDYIEYNICSFSMSNKKRQIKSNISKVNRSHSSKHATAKQLERLIEKIGK